ncbi:MAG: hypothetical protein HY644_10745 [Acidobacteria bacterium]|nr:hypothetical protein [Acidobacteriota bacterium]
MDFLTALGQDVEITVRPTRKSHGEVVRRCCNNSVDASATEDLPRTDCCRKVADSGIEKAQNQEKDAIVGT